MTLERDEETLGGGGREALLASFTRNHFSASPRYGDERETLGRGWDGRRKKRERMKTKERESETNVE